MKKILLTLMTVVLAFGAMSQTIEGKKRQDWCGSHDVLNKQTEDNSTFAGNISLLESEDFSVTVESRKITIPVVIHVVYRDSSEIPSQEELNIQIEGLNNDFNSSNWDLYKVDSRFKKLISDTKISFKLATVSPKGGKTDGITYTKTEKSYFTMNDGVKHDSTGGKAAWDSRRYLNVWVCNLDDVRGYAQFPGGESSTDGVVVTFSDIGTYDNLADKNGVSHVVHARVLTHEVGHWLGLRHIWGDSFCGDDKVRDTPSQMSPHWYCPTLGEVVRSCGSIDLTNNFMDYLDFECMLMFTKGQKQRMWKSLVMFRKEMLMNRNRNLTK